MAGVEIRPADPAAQHPQQDPADGGLDGIHVRQLERFLSARDRSHADGTVTYGPVSYNWAIEALNRQLRKALGPKGSFPSEDATRKLIYLAIQNAVPQWTRPAGGEQRVFLVRSRTLSLSR